MKPKNPTWKKIDDQKGRALYQRHRARVAVLPLSGGGRLLVCLKENQERVIHDFVDGEHEVVENGGRVHIIVPPSSVEVSDG